MQLPFLTTYHFTNYTNYTNHETNKHTYLDKTMDTRRTADRLRMVLIIYRTGTGERQRADSREWN